MKYKIYVDTNQFHPGQDKGDLSEPLNNALAGIRKFLDTNKVNNVIICVPDIVVRERVQHRLEEISRSVDKANIEIKALKLLGHELAEIPLKDDYKTTLNENAEKQLKKYKAVRVPTPEVGREDLIERAVSKLKPFNDKGSGFKDTLIYLSIVEDATGPDASDGYLLCTNNSKDFTEELEKEFRELTDKELYILPDLNKAQEKLDELVPLNLKLEERNRKIQNLVYNNTGLLTELANKTIQKPYSSGDPFTSFYSPDMTYATYESPYGSVLGRNRYSQSSDEIIGYTYSGITFNDYSDSGSDHYKVSLELSTDIIYREAESDSGFTGSINASVFRMRDTRLRPYRNQWRFPTKTFRVEADVDLKTTQVTVTSITPNLY